MSFAVTQRLWNYLPTIGSKPCCNAADTQSSKNTLFGFDVKPLSNGLKTIATLTSVTECFHSTTKFIASFAGAVAPVFVLDKLAISMIQVDQFIDSARLVADVKHLIGLSYVDDILKGRYMNAASDVSFLIADLGASMSFLGYLKLVDLEKVSSALGGLALFGHHVPALFVDVAVGTLSLHVQTIAFLFKGLQTASDIASKGATKDRLLWLVTCIFELVHKTFLFLAGSALLTPHGVVTAGVLGMLANGLGVWAAYEDVTSSSK